MTVTPDVARIARQFAGASPNFPRLIQAVSNSEGDLIRAVQCSYPNVLNREDAIAYTARTWDHFAWDFIFEHCLDAFLDYGGNKWAPPNAANDPKRLNVNFIPNMRKFLELDR